MKTKTCSRSVIGDRVQGSLLLAIALLVHPPAISRAETVVEQWVQRYNGPGNSHDQPRAVAVDHADNVIVCGISFAGAGSIGSDDYCTAKYAAADGLLLREKPHGAYSVSDVGVFAAVDGPGNVVVAGASAESNNVNDTAFCTVKFASAVDADHDGLLDPRELGHFGTTAGHSAHDDADKDGRVELLEMAFGGDPLVSDAGMTPSAVAEDGYLTITITKHPGVRYEVQSAGDLAGSSFSAATTAVLIDNSGTFKVRDNVAIGSADRRFLRVLVPAAP